MNKIPQIGIVYEEGHEPLNEIANDLFNDVIHQDIDIRVEPRPEMGPLACVEWYIPTALFIFFSRAYFDSIFKEMGKDHYEILKNGIPKIWGKLFSKDRVINIRVVGTAGKVPKDLVYSLAFSILGEFKDNITFKFLFEDSISENDFNERICLIINFLNSIHTNMESVQDYFVLHSGNFAPGRTILIGYDPIAKKLTAVDPRGTHKPLSNS